MFQTKKIIIVGGGFAGVQTALELSRKNKSKHLEIVLISDNEYFEYRPSLHGFLSKKGPAKFHRLLLSEIFKNSRVQIIIDKVIECDLSNKTITTKTGMILSSDYLVLALGSEPAYFGIEGLQDTSFPFQTVADAQKLRTHILDIFETHCTEEKISVDCVAGLHFIVVGAGPNGVDLAGELTDFSRSLAREKGFPESFVAVDLVEGAPTVLPMMSEQVQKKVTQRLYKLGVNLLCNRQLLKQDELGIELVDMKVGTKTVIWTAGSTGNNLTTKISNITLQKKNRISVNEYLEIEEFPNCFVVGDIADTEFSGLAQTAIHNGLYVAKIINNKIQEKALAPYQSKPVAYNIGVGHGWSVMQIGNIVVSGKIASWVRSLINMKYFFSILPMRKVFQLFFHTKNH